MPDCGTNSCNMIASQTAASTHATALDKRPSPQTQSATSIFHSTHFHTRSVKSLCGVIMSSGTVPWMHTQCYGRHITLTKHTEPNMKGLLSLGEQPRVIPCVAQCKGGGDGLMEISGYKGPFWQLQ